MSRASGSSPAGVANDEAALYAMIEEKRLKFAQDYMKKHMLEFRDVCEQEFMAWCLTHRPGRTRGDLVANDPEAIAKHAEIGQKWGAEFGKQCAAAWDKSVQK